MIERTLFCCARLVRVVVVAVAVGSQKFQSMRARARSMISICNVCWSTREESRDQPLNCCVCVCVCICSCNFTTVETSTMNDLPLFRATCVCLLLRHGSNKSSNDANKNTKTLQMGQSDPKQQLAYKQQTAYRKPRHTTETGLNLCR